MLKDYPDAKRILNARARKLMKENEERLVREMSEQQKQRRKTQNLKADEIVELASSDQVSHEEVNTVSAQVVSCCVFNKLKKYASNAWQYFIHV